MTDRRQFLLSASAAALAAALPGSLLAQEATRIGFVYVSPIGDAGWTFQHDLARKELEAALGSKVQTKYVENVAEGADAERVIREFAASGHRIVFATSFGYMNYVERVARQFPQVTFLHATGYKSGKNFGHYNARFYEGRYLTGVIAGRMSKSKVLGYVAAFPIPEVLQGINAFTLGAKSVNPDVEVRVIWVNAWYDPGKEREAAMTLISQGADIVTQHTDSTAVVQAAEERGVHAFGYHSDMSKYGPKAHLTATTHHWGDFYTKTVNEVLAGTWKPAGVWGGFKDDMVRLAPLNPAIPAPVRDEVAALQDKLRTGGFHPFTGPIVDQAGKERLSAGAVMDDVALGKMDFFVQGVASRLPNAR
ncbi:BMP family ABC transporter substrate-binding protein [Pseudothauera rhizosphaerae]|uniref:BMP family ABC transporter substrate-binding protein n=1 Tax=Pseudothauera rhizosphaerae TaxID=2565932 RepID=A0A4S4AN35_9RHOO|nr:BMP family ABC transporter substrate-binding protein [Pseudothauera rhizosphaerae]THF60958.1 BMP family ABC transporter substrate-binding protein [Pseudothauera rhizosphaerae]